MCSISSALNRSVLTTPGLSDRDTLPAEGVGNSIEADASRSTFPALSLAAAPHTGLYHSPAGDEFYFSTMKLFNGSAFQTDPYGPHMPASTRLAARACLLDAHSSESDVTLISAHHTLPVFTSAVDAGSDGIIKVWQLRADAHLVRCCGLYTGHGATSITGLHVLSQGAGVDWAASVSKTSAYPVHLWDLERLDCVRAFPSLGDDVWMRGCIGLGGAAAGTIACPFTRLGQLIDLAPDGAERCAVADSGIAVYDARAGRAVTVIRSTGLDYNTVAITSVASDTGTNSALIAAGLSDGTLTVLDLRMGLPLLRWTSETRFGVSSVTWQSVDEICSASEDGVVRFWRIDTQRAADAVLVCSQRVCSPSSRPGPLLGFEAGTMFVSSPDHRLWTWKRSWDGSTSAPAPAHCSRVTLVTDVSKQAAVDKAQVLSWARVQCVFGDALVMGLSGGSLLVT